MSARWFAFKDDQQIGPMTSAEIRAGLREGRLDPFDLICREGSQIKMELVQVDEIFAESDSSPMEPTEFVPPPEDLNKKTTLSRNRNDGPSEESGPGVYQPSHLAEDTSEDVDQTLKSPPQSKTPPLMTTELTPPEEIPSFTVQKEERTQVAEIPKEKLPKKDERRDDTQKKRRQSKKEPKKFFLTDKNKRVLGPLSAREIQSLFYRGILDQSVKVSKENSDKKVGVAQFVSVYSGAKAARYKSEFTRMELDQPASWHMDGLPRSRVMDELAKINQLKAQFESPWHMIGKAIVAGLLFLGAATALDLYFNNGKIVRRLTKPETISIPETTSRPIVNEPEPTEVIANTTPPKVEPIIPEPKPKRKKTEQKAETRPQNLTPPPPQPRRYPAPVVQPQHSAQTNLAARSPVTLRGNSGGSMIAQLEGKVGQQATVGPLRFSADGLAKCSLKCNLIFTDSSGRSLTARFFKGQFAPTLLAKGSQATISGTVKKEGAMIVLLLSKVQ